MVSVLIAAVLKIEAGGALEQQRWERMKVLLDAALETAPERRTSLLAVECGDDTALRNEVATLLEHHENAGSFLAIKEGSDASVPSTPSQPAFSANEIIAGRFPIARFIGAGGMGEVYEARDLELGTRVALKTLRPEIAFNAWALDRLRQEIQLARQVTHPNVCRIFDMGRHRAAGAHEGESTDRVFFTMELLVGESLADRLHREGQVSVRTALPMIRQMADALQAAHEVGVVHRDFKPSNVILIAKSANSDNKVRAVVTDFGLARAAVGSSLAAESFVQTLSKTGQLLGTLAYMAPEQLEGREPTPATDVYALGLVIYEMVTGRRPFPEDAPLAGAFLRIKQPPPFPRIYVPDLDAGFEQSIMLCLRTDPATRFQSAREVAESLENSVGHPAAAGRSREIAFPRTVPNAVEPKAVDRKISLSWFSAFPKTVRSLVGAGIALGVLLALMLWYSFTHSGAALKVLSTRSTIAPPPTAQLLSFSEPGGPLSLSPDGTRAVFTAKEARSPSRLFLRRLDALESEPLAGTEGATYPFWSPDGSRIGFFADFKLKTLNLSDGSIRIVSEGGWYRGGTWGAGDTILFAGSTQGPILKVSANGGDPIPVTTLNGSPYTTHRWPEFLPDGHHFLYLAANHTQASSIRAAIFLGSLDGHPPRLLAESDSNAQLVSGQLVFAWGGKLVGQAFDLHTGKTESTNRILADRVEYDAGLWHATFSATPQALVYRPPGERPQANVLAWFSESGTLLKAASGPGIFRDLSVSPNGQTVATTCDDPDMSVCLVHEDGTSTRISGSLLAQDPVWSPDGTTLVYLTHPKGGKFDLMLKDARGKSPERRLLESDVSSIPASWAPNQRELLLLREDHELAIFGFQNEKTRTFLTSGFRFSDGRFSPDGNWVAYQSNESGREDVYVTSYPLPEQKYLVSRGGGRAPRWSANGKDLYFLDPSDTILRVHLSGVAGGRLSIGPAEELFQPPVLPPPTDSRVFDVTGSPPRFIVNTLTSTNTSPYVLVTSWAK